MMKRQHTITPQGGLTASHTRIQTHEKDAAGDTRYFRTQTLDARRCPDHHEGDQAQIEIVLASCEGKSRVTQMRASMILTPEQARALALTICPELGAQ